MSGPPAAVAPYHGDYISSINEVKQWLSYKVEYTSLDEFIYLLLDHGYDDLGSIAECTNSELEELVALFSTPESKKSIQTLVEALRQLGIDVYRKQKSEFRRLIDIEEKHKKQEVYAEQVSRVRGQSQAVSKPPTVNVSLVSSNSVEPASPSSSNSTSTTTPSSTASSAAASAATAAAPATPSSTLVKSPSGERAPIKLPPPLAASASSTAASSTAASPASSNPTSVFDVSTWEGSIHFQAYLHSIQCYARAFDEPILPPAELETKLLDGRSAAHLQKIKRFLAALVEGCVFKKFKRGSSSKRLIWTSQNFDFVVWGEEDKSLIKGYINTHDIQEINQGFAMKNKNRLYIVSPERTLELEAKDGLQAKEWKEMLEFLIQLNMSELEQKRALQTGSGQAAFQAKFAKAKADYTKLVSTGSVFKKWPGAGKMGSFTTRLVWSPPVVDRLQWGDLLTKKVMGFVLIQDMVEIKEHPDDKQKFTIFTIKRSLDLEARDEKTRARWIKALRFFIEFKQQAVDQTK